MTDEVCKLCAQSVEAHRLGHYCGMFVTDEDPRTKALRTRIAELERILGVFLGHDDRFQIMVGGNPAAVEEMMEQARATLNGEKVDG